MADMGHLPELMEEARADALAKAAEARHDRAELLHGIKDGRIDPAGVLMRRDGSQVVERTRALAFVKAWPGYGDARARKLMAQLGIAEGRRLGGLGSRQRQGLLDAIAEAKAKKSGER